MQGGLNLRLRVNKPGWMECCSAGNSMPNAAPAGHVLCQLTANSAPTDGSASRCTTCMLVRLSRSANQIDRRDRHTSSVSMAHPQELALNLRRQAGQAQIECDSQREAGVRVEGMLQ